MKERLTEAALDLIWHNSYGATSVDAICERAGAAKGSFYYFFKSKSELAIAALDIHQKGTLKGSGFRSGLEQAEGGYG